MTTPTASTLTAKRCVPCEGGVPTLTAEEIVSLLPAVPGWRVVEEGTRLRREWTAKNFRAGMDFFNAVTELAEDEGHHPDLHLVGYRGVAIEVWTHAIGGLSENDFVLAAKIDRIPIRLKGEITTR